MVYISGFGPSPQHLSIPILPNSGSEGDGPLHFIELDDCDRLVFCFFYPRFA
jgi:hypothetical protein